VPSQPSPAPTCGEEPTWEIGSQLRRMIRPDLASRRGRRPAHMRRASPVPRSTRAGIGFRGVGKPASPRARSVEPRPPRVGVCPPPRLCDRGRRHLPATAPGSSPSAARVSSPASHAMSWESRSRPSGSASRPRTWISITTTVASPPRRPSTPRSRPKGSSWWVARGADRRGTTRCRGPCRPPSMWHAIFLRPETSTASKPTGARSGRGGAPRCSCRAEEVRHYFASWSFSLITYKALVISDRLTEFYPDLAADGLRRPARGVPQPLLHQHRAGVGARAAVPSAVPQRRDQHAARQRERACRRAVGLGTEEVGSARRISSARCTIPTTPTRGSSTPRSSCSCTGAATSVTRWRCSCPRRGRANATDRATCATSTATTRCLTDPWDGPAGLVFTDGTRVGASLDRNGLRPLRWQVATTVWWCARPRWARCRSRARRRCGAAGSARARCCASIPARRSRCRTTPP
jgi:hypothetical protein